MKVLTWIVVIVVVLGGLWYVFGRSSNSMPSTEGTPTAQAPEANGTTAMGSASASSDTSDAALNQDSAAFDTQLQAANTDASSASSFSDTPVQQTE